VLVTNGPKRNVEEKKRRRTNFIKLKMKETRSKWGIENTTRGEGR
jgi:hypothetical protein